MVVDGLSISQVARMAGVNVETVRFYERQLMIAPPPRGAGGSRLYSAGVVDRIRFIRQAKDLGYSLREIRELLSLQEEERVRQNSAEQPVDAALIKLDQKIDALLQIRAALEERHGTRSLQNEHRSSGVPPN